MSVQYNTHGTSRVLIICLDAIIHLSYVFPQKAGVPVVDQFEILLKKSMIAKQRRANPTTENMR
jgi:hypothetical protein